ncbi:uncharacterized protein METZ01_LOCUS243737 [marine metagenome]|uniref:Uncharacterized protein n=1 Tax=marine metagenome TaxID=408172 RepID=A0A382HW81_9ZZZZ
MKTSGLAAQQLGAAWPQVIFQWQKSFLAGLLQLAEEFLMETKKAELSAFPQSTSALVEDLAPFLEFLMS